MHAWHNLNNTLQCHINIICMHCNNTYVWYKYSVAVSAICCMFIPDSGCYFALHLCIAPSQSFQNIFIYLCQYDICFAFLCSLNKLKCGEWACFGAFTGGSYFEGV